MNKWKGHTLSLLPPCLLLATSGTPLVHRISGDTWFRTNPIRENCTNDHVALGFCSNTTTTRDRCERSVYYSPMLAGSCGEGATTHSVLYHSLATSPTLKTLIFRVLYFNTRNPIFWSCFTYPAQNQAQFHLFSKQKTKIFF